MTIVLSRPLAAVIVLRTSCDDHEALHAVVIANRLLNIILLMQVLTQTLLVFQDGTTLERLVLSKIRNRVTGWEYAYLPSFREDAR